MTKIVIHCKVISPLFIGNANTKNAELRPHIFKSSMRYWWRVLNPKLNNVAMRKQEAVLLGGNYTEGNEEKTKKPPFRFINIEQPKISTSEEPLDSRPEKARNGNGYNIPAGENFTLTLNFINESKINNILNLLFIASALGGVGQRARRGAGAWKIESVEGVKFNPVYSLDEIKHKIEEVNVNEEINLNYKPQYNTSIENINSYSHLLYVQNICLSQNKFNTQEELRKHIMIKAHELNSNRFFSTQIGSTSKSSSVYISMIENENGLFPIVTILNNLQNHNNLQTDFANLILQLNEQ